MNRYTHTKQNTSPTPVAHDAEPMVDAMHAASALSLPYYWFVDQAMRKRHRIPHYVMGSLIRFRMSDLLVWVSNNSSVCARHGGGR